GSRVAAVDAARGAPGRLQHRLRVRGRRGRADRRRPRRGRRLAVARVVAAAVSLHAPPAPRRRARSALARAPAARLRAVLAGLQPSLRAVRAGGRARLAPPLPLRSLLTQRAVAAPVPALPA